MRIPWIGILALALSPAGHAGGADWRQLVQELARHAPPMVAYEEEVHAFYLEQPMVNRGTLERRPDGALIKRVEQPRPLEMRLARGKVQVRGAQGRPVQPQNMPAPLQRMLADALPAVFNGDARRIAELFQARLEPAAGKRWKLTLVPRDREVRDWFAALVLEGRGHRLEAFRLVQPNGDYAVTRLLPRSRARP